MPYPSTSAQIDMTHPFPTNAEQKIFIPHFFNSEIGTAVQEFGLFRGLTVVINSSSNDVHLKSSQMDHVGVECF